MFIHDVIVFQANCIFDVLEDMVRAIPAQDIHRGEKPRLVPGRQALHILGGFDRYSTRGENRAKTFGQIHGTFSRRYDANEAPSKQEILAYLRAVRKQFADFVGSLPEDFFSKTTNTKRGRFVTKLGKYLYLIRHNTLHLGYLRNELIERGYKLGEFK